MSGGCEPGHRGVKLEYSPVRGTPGGRGGRTSSTARNTGNAKRGLAPTNTGVTAGGSGVPGPGRTPQTKRRELSLTTEKNSPSGSPRNTTRGSSPNIAGRKGGGGQNSKNKSETRDGNNGSSAGEESSRKSSNSSQDSGIGRDSGRTVRSRGQGGRRTAGEEGQGRRSGRPTSLRTGSPETADVEVSNRKKFEELCDVKNVELGIVKVPEEVLDELIHKEKLEKFYTVDEVPVASGLFATVRKCTHKETGVEYAAKFSSRIRCGVDCTGEVLHEIALLSVCAESNKIVHLKDVFQNKHEIILILEYAPGGDFQSVLDDDMVPFEQDVQGFLYQLLEALAFIHERKIAHLDIKPQNIVLMSEFPNCEIKLCDLEVSRVIQDTEDLREIIGTPDYVAPEILQMEPITLSADIWSLGVLAYVLLTGFSPFGGDTDQETLRNITTAPLDFPDELFEGVSEDAKDFISACLNRDPAKRPTVQQCLQLPWIDQNSEPPSPSPLMLKIPAPDRFLTTPKLSVHSPTSSSRRSCQTCRDKRETERKRYLSKSREAIFEKVANSQLKKSLSKSRERLCDMRLTLSKSRDYLNESKIASRSQDKFYGFKSLSKSQEVVSAALGGNMKRMINGAVSDISHTHLPINPRVYLDTADTCDFVILPGISVLMSHSDLMSISASKSSGSLQLLPISESGRSTPASLCSVTTVADIAYTENNNEQSTGMPGINKQLHETLIEVSEEDVEEEEVKGRRTRSNGTITEHPGGSEIGIVKRDPDWTSIRSERRKSINEGMLKGCKMKEEKDSLNYETKQSMSSSQSEHSSNKVDMGVQVNLIKCSSSPNLLRKDKGLQGPVKEVVHFGNEEARGPSRRLEKNVEKPLIRGFSHDDTLGEDQKRYSWREELERFRAMKKPLRVSELIDTFSNKTSESISGDLTMPDIHALKSRRRGSLQIQIDSKALAQLTETVEEQKLKKAAKLQRRKSTSAIHPVRLSEDKIQTIMPIKEVDYLSTKVGEIDIVTSNENIASDEKGDTEKAVMEKGDCEDVEVSTADGPEDDDEPNKDFNSTSPAMPRGRAYLEKVNERKRTWDYFEINHPKAISDKKLQQLKAKYTRRKTDANLHTKCENQKPAKPGPSLKHVPPPPSRTLSLPVMDGVGGSVQTTKSLDLAYDPFTGECLSVDSESVDSGQGSEIMRKVSTDSSEASSSRKSSQRKSSHLGDITETDKIIPAEMVLECFIDPFTGKFITNEVCKPKATPNKPEKKTKNANLKVSIPAVNGRPDGQPDDGIGSSLPDTPTDLGRARDNRTQEASDRESLNTDDGIFTAERDEILGRSADNENNDQVSVVSGGGDSQFSEKRCEEEENEPQSRQRGLVNSDSRVCTGSFSRGFERFGGESPTSGNA